MAWEKRGNQSYFYRKYRSRSRVLSQYLGKGPVASIAAAELAKSKRERRAERQRERQIRNEEREIDREICREGKALEQTIRQFLQLLGYHNHHGTWRRRGGTDRQVSRAAQRIGPAV